MHPSKYTVEIRDKRNRLKAVITDKVSISWEYARIGGCGSGAIELCARYEEGARFEADDDVQVYGETDKGRTILWYRGFIDSIQPVLAVDEKVLLKVSGYASQLKRICVQRTYTNKEVSLIVKDILDQDVVPNTKIVYDAVDIEPAVFCVDTITFDTMADEAIKMLADLAGKTEWGVDRRGQFFFKKQKDTIAHSAAVGVAIEVLDNYIDFGSIVNCLHIKGGKNEHMQFTDIVQNAESQALYGLREKILSHAAIVTSSVSQRYGTMLLLESARAQRKASLKIKHNQTLYEETLPLGMIAIIPDTIISGGKKYGIPDAVYGTFLYGGNLWSAQISRLRYQIADFGTDLVMEIAHARPSIAEQMKQLEFQINQIRST